MMLRVMREVVHIPGVREDQIWVHLCNLAPTDRMEYRHVRPGQVKKPSGSNGCRSHSGIAY
jgi:hypothetical protein